MDLVVPLDLEFVCLGLGLVTALMSPKTPHSVLVVFSHSFQSSYKFTKSRQSLESRAQRRSDL